MQGKPVKDFREAIARAEERGELVRINREVEPLVDLPSLMKASAIKGRIPTLLFENVAGFPHMRGTSGLFSELPRLADLLGLPADRKKVNNYLVKAMDNPIAPKVVNSGPCKENIITQNIDIDKFIFFTHGALKVKSRYLCPVVITKHPLNNRYNAGAYRTCIQDADKITVNMRHHQHGWLHLNEAMERGEALPVALCIGVHPALYTAASTRLKYDEDEYHFTGAVLGRPLELVKAETIDLLVPADAEIVIEGEIRPPYTLGDDGPWPEYLRYMGMEIHPPIMQITGITYRDNPIQHVQVPGTVPELVGMHGPAFLRSLRQNAGEFVVDARLVGSRHCAIIQVKKTLEQHEGMQVDVALSAFHYGMMYFDIIIVVDEDIDIYDLNKVFWAMVTRCDAKEQVHIINGTRGHENNPIAGVKHEFGLPITKSKMIIDATIPFHYKKMKKEEDVNFFSLSTWKELDLEQYISAEDIKKWFEK